MVALGNGDIGNIRVSLQKRNIEHFKKPLKIVNIFAAIYYNYVQQTDKNKRTAFTGANRATSNNNGMGANLPQ